jgi:hypothetical protein
MESIRFYDPIIGERAMILTFYSSRLDKFFVWSIVLRLNEYFFLRRFLCLNKDQIQIHPAALNRAAADKAVGVEAEDAVAPISVAEMVEARMAETVRHVVQGRKALHKGITGLKTLLDRLVVEAAPEGVEAVF